MFRYTDRENPNCIRHLRRKIIFEEATWLEAEVHAELKNRGVCRHNSRACGASSTDPLMRHSRWSAGKLDAWRAAVHQLSARRGRLGQAMKTTPAARVR